MSIYRIYDDNGYLLCLDKSNGSFISLDSPSRIHDVVDKFIIDGYKIILDGNNMILKSKNNQLHLSNYADLLKNYYLTFLDYDIRNTMDTDGYSSFDDAKKNFKFFKGSINAFLSKTACTSLLFSMVCNFLPVNMITIARGDSVNGGTSSSLIDEVPSNSGNTKNGEGIISDIYESGEKLAEGALHSAIVDAPAIVSEIIEEVPKFTDEEIEKVYEFIDFNHLTLEKFESLIELMTSEDAPFGALYSSSEEAIRALASEELSYKVKFLTIMVREGNTYAEIDKLCAGVVGEATGGGNCYEDAYAVASTLINRTHKDSYVNKYGFNLYSQFCAPGQYEVDISGNYKQFLGQIDLEGYHAAIDAFYTRESMHKYIEFRANWVDLTYYEMFVPGGNKFIAKMKDSQYVPYPEEEIELDDVKVLVLENAN